MHLKVLFHLFLFICGSQVYAQKGLKAEFYDGTNFERFVSEKYVDKIQLAWYSEPPVPGINPHECSIRWTGKLKPALSGNYSFSARVDDGIRVFIDGQLIINQWQLNDEGKFEGSLDLIADKEYDLVVEYFNALYEGEIQLLWKKNKKELSWYERMFGDGIVYEVIDAEYFFRPEIPKKAEVNAPQPKSTKKENTATSQKPRIKSPPKKKATRTKQKRVASPKPKEVKRPDPVEVKPEVIEQYIPKNVQFKKGKTTILADSYAELDEFAEFMLKHTSLNMKIEGHTDVVGDPEMNLQLSKDRAKTVSEYLIKKGIESKRIRSEGFGGTQPLVKPKPGEYHPANRRVVFIIE